MDSPQISHAIKRHRYEITLGRDIIGQSRYRDHGNQRIFLHTEVEPDYRGHGLATQLIEWALADTREAGMRIVAQCPTVTAYLARHHEYDDIRDVTDVAPL